MVSNMPTVLLIRHGRTTANASGVLAGRKPGIALDERGIEQVATTGTRLSAVPLRAVVSSPLDRCQQTAQAILDRQDNPPALRIEPQITECGYGSWQGKPLADLAKEPLWSVVQNQPSAVTFPDGESLRHMQARAVESIRRTDRAIAEQHGEHAVWAAVSHGDIIKSILADALGMHLDLFQRLNVDPASVSIINYGPRRPAVLSVNSAAGDLGWLARSAPAADAAVGGGAGQTAEGEHSSTATP